MGTAKVFQVSDLANNRTEFIDEARSGLARLRDKDGTSLVMLPEARLDHLQRLQDLNEIYLRLSHLIVKGKPASPVELGQHSWLRVFDLEAVEAWRMTARQLSDPLRRSILLGDVKPSELATAARPESEGDDAVDE
jgi:hypothetical protein